MGSILIHTQDESVTLTAQAVRRLLDGGAFSDAIFLAGREHPGLIRQMVALP